MAGEGACRSEIPHVWRHGRPRLCEAMKRSTLILLAVVAVAVAAILLWERKRPGTDASKAAEGRLFPDMPEAKEFTRLERAGDAPLVLEKAGEAWALRTPIQDAADGYGVEGFLDQIRQAKAVRFIEAPVPWKDLGLGKPRASWILRTGAATFDISVGSAAGMGEGLYLKVGDRAALAPAHLEQTLLKAPGEFRARDLVPPGAGRVVSFRVVRPGAPALSASRSGEDWTLKEPFIDDADEAKVEPLLDEVAFAQAASFVDADPAKDFGLAPPRAEVTLTTDKGKTVTVSLGADAPAEPAGGGDGAVEQERIYASVSGRPSVLVVPAKILKALDVVPDALRSAELFRHTSADAEELAVEGAYSRNFKRDASGVWGDGAPAKAPSNRDPGPAAEALLARRASTVEARTPGSTVPKAFLTLVLKGKGFEERVDVGPEVDGKRYAFPRSRTVALLLDGEAWRRAEAALKAVPLAPAGKK